MIERMGFTPPLPLQRFFLPGYMLSPRSSGLDRKETKFVYESMHLSSAKGTISSEANDLVASEETGLQPQ